VIQIEGRVIRFGSPDGDRQGVRVLRGSLKHEPVSARAEGIDEKTQLAAIHLGWSVEELRAFAQREGYEWLVGSFDSYVRENWGLWRFPPQRGPRVILARSDGAVDVLFDAETKRVREVLRHFKGKDVVQAQWRAAVLRFGPNQTAAVRGYSRVWKSAPEGIVVEFQPKGIGSRTDGDEAFVRLVAERPSDWILCPEHEGLQLWLVNTVGMTPSEHPFYTDTSVLEFDPDPDGVWLVCAYGIGAWAVPPDLDKILFSEAINIEGEVIQSGSPDGKHQGVRVVKGSLRREPLIQRAEDLAKDTELAGVHLGWSEDELHIFAKREGYEWHDGDFVGYVSEDWRLSSAEGHRVALTRLDRTINVVFHSDRKRVREVLLHLAGPDVVLSYWRGMMVRFGPAQSDLQYLDGFMSSWKNRSEGVILEFERKVGGFAYTGDEAFLLLADVNP
jgi:hypothetical protein